jgi:MFS family permease
MLAGSRDKQYGATELKQVLVSPNVDGVQEVSWKSIPTRRWISTGVVILFFLFDIFARLLPSAITTTLQQDFDFNASAVSSAFGSSVFAAYACTQLGHGILLDVLGPRRQIALMAFIATGGNLLFALSPSNGAKIAVAGRVMTGVGIGCAWLGCFQVINLNFAPSQRGVVVGVALAIGYMGGLICNAPLLALVHALGWRHAVAVSRWSFNSLFFLLKSPFPTSPPPQTPYNPSHMLPIVAGVRGRLSAVPRRG